MIIYMIIYDMETFTKLHTNFAYWLKDDILNQANILRKIFQLLIKWMAVYNFSEPTNCLRTKKMSVSLQSCRGILRTVETFGCLCLWALQTISWGPSHYWLLWWPFQVAIESLRQKFREVIDIYFIIWLHTHLFYSQRIISSSSMVGL